MTTGYVALNVEGFQVCGTPIRDETRVLQSIKSTITGVKYCFYSLGTRDVQYQFDSWVDRFVRVREAYHIERQKMPEWTKRVPEKEQKEQKS
jgi:predicted RNA-binding protein with EMAP domain